MFGAEERMGGVMEGNKPNHRLCRGERIMNKKIRDYVFIK